jgi:hypothetical protein
MDGVNLVMAAHFIEVTTCSETPDRIELPHVAGQAHWGKSGLDFKLFGCCDYDT